MPSRLKSLELQGYKTFASKTIFEFASSVTAIVGPNGSGKSNIADSLRWVLGEQSYSLLRGKKTEDMIFSGSEGRSRAGMASATVLFDNEDGWLPIDFSEVAISRRAYRDGQNEYLINNQRVRLRDVTELLSQSGLAERTYTVIGQGVVDAALALKAEERRRLFEEAAGIGLHRSRREEALRRLETTQRNLDRVQDILAELRPRLRSLERQARRTQEYEQVRNDLNELLKEFYGYHWHEAQRDLRKARVFAGSQERELESVRQLQAEIDSRTAAMRNSISAIRSDLNIWHRKLSDLHSQREAINREQAVAAERARSLNEQKYNFENEIARLKDELILHTERLDIEKAEVEKLKNEREDANSRVEIARKSFDDLLSERQKIEVAIEKVRDEIDDLQSDLRELEAKVSERRSRIERFQSELENGARELEESRAEVERVKQDAFHAHDILERTEHAHREAESRLEEQQSEIAELDEQLRELRQQRSDQVAESTRLRARLEVLDQADASLVGYGKGAQVLLKAINEDRLVGGLGAVSGVLFVDAEYETAVAAALGEFLDAILIGQGSNIDGALDLLEKETSRGALLPLEALRINNPDLDLSGQGVLGRAVDLVKTAPEYEKVVQFLLSNTWIVRDRSQARKMIDIINRDSHNGYSIRIVTLRGEVFYLDGAIVTGGTAHSATLSRPRERRSIETQLENTELGLQEIQSSLDKNMEVMAGIREEQQELQRALRNTQEDEEEARKKHRHISLMLEEAVRKTSWLEERRKLLSKDLQETSEEINGFEKQITMLGKEIDSANERHQELTEMLNGLEMDEQRAEVSHWNTVYAVADRALRDAQARLEERYKLFERVRVSSEDTNTRKSEIEQELTKLDEDQAVVKENSVELLAEIEELTNNIDPAEKYLATFEEGLEGLLTEESELRNRLSGAEHRHSQARINLARRQEALETWRRRIEDDFGLVAFEYDAEVSGPTPLPLNGMVEQLPRVDKISDGLEEAVRRQRNQLRRMGAINPEAKMEYEEVRTRFDFMTAQLADLEQAEADVRQVIAELDDLMQRELKQTYDAVASEFSEIFKRLFGGGSARLVLTDPEDMTNTGIDIEARLPGRREQGLSLLSGGERSLTATSLVFSLLKVSPTPFCVLDEVDAMLDEANVGRFRELLRELSKQTQFVIVTHNRNTVQVADVIYGVTMGRDSASQVISLKLDEVSDLIE